VPGAGSAAEPGTPRAPRINERREATPVSAAAGTADPPGAGGSASLEPVVSTSPAPPSPPPRGTAAPVGSPPDRPARPTTATTGSAHRPARATPPADPEIANLLKEAEDAYRKNLKPLQQLGLAGAVLRAQPGNLRARFLAGDALIKDGDMDNGCKYLAMAKALAVARARARAAGCPDD
jgi:hypothetical protein